MTLGVSGAQARMAGWFEFRAPPCGGCRESPEDSPGLTLTWTGRGQVSGEASLTIRDNETPSDRERAVLVQTPQLRNSCPWDQCTAPGDRCCPPETKTPPPTPQTSSGPHLSSRSASKAVSPPTPPPRLCSWGPAGPRRPSHPCHSRGQLLF